MSLITRCPACETLFKVVPDQLRISEGWVRCGQCDEIFDASLHLLQGSPDESADVAHTEADGPDPDRSAELSDASFLLDKKADSFWHKSLLRATLVVLSLVLLLGLAGQIVFHERDRIVASQPGLKPWLLAFCGLLNCTLSPLRRIESIVLDSASFSKIQGDSYRLNFTLKNTAAVALAVPAIELTLTDTLDQPAIRRVFFPSELGVQSDTLAAGSEWPASLAMAVKTGGTVDRVAGYRLLVFYP